MLRSTCRLLLAVGLILLPAFVNAQSTGTISGTVTDSTGAVVPDAKVSVVNMATNDIRRSVSTGQGVFSVPGLVDGDYSIRIEARGFKTWEIAGIHVLPGDHKSIPGISLEIGTASEVVNVTATEAQLQVTDSGDRAAVLDSQQVTGLGLEGRDVTELVRTLPGFANTVSGLGNSSYDASRTGIVAGNQMSSFSGQGQQYGQASQDLISDGARVVDPGCNCSSTQTIDADMVAEVKVTTSAFSAESWHGPVVVEAVGKSGSADYHGSIYSHYRDSVMNSNSYAFKLNDLPRFASHYTYLGGNVGGPVLIPHTNFNKNKKLVFWAGYEYYGQYIPDTLTGGLFQDNLPTLSERSGHFDPTLSDNAINCAALLAAPATSYFAGYRCGGIQNMYVPSVDVKGNPSATLVAINNSDISGYLGAGAKSFLSLTPTPNTTPTAAHPYNYIAPAAANDNGFIFHTRIDYAFSDSTKLYISYNYQNDDQLLPVGQYYQFGNGIKFPAGMKYMNRSHTLAGNLVKIFSPSLINEFKANFAYVNIPIQYSTGSQVTKTATNFPYTNLGSNSKYIPQLANLIGAAVGVPSLGMADLSNYYATKMTPEVMDTVTILAGKHSMKFGIDWQNIDNKELNIFSPGPNSSLYVPILPYLIYGFGPTGPMFADGNNNGLADFMVDITAPGTGSFTNGYGTMDDLGEDLGQMTIGAFIQDDYKVTKNLTLNLGMRADHFGGVTDRSSNGNGLAVFSTNWYLADGGANAASSAFAPGVRYHAIDHDVPMSGRPTPLFAMAPRFGVAFDVFGTGKTVVRGGYGFYYYPDSYGQYAGPDGQANGARTCGAPNGSASSFLGQAIATLPGLNAGQGVICAKSNAYQVGSYPSLSVADAEDLKQQLTYTYNFGISQRTWKNTVLEVAYSGNQSVNQMSGRNINAVPAGAYFADTQHTTYDIYNGTTQLKNSFRPMPNYSSVTMQGHEGWANYNSLQVTWNKMTGVFIYGLNYTWSKTLGIPSAANVGATYPDPINFHNDYGVMATDRSHVLNATYAYTVKNFFNNRKLLYTMINGWTVTGISSLQSGANIAVNTSGNFGLTGTGSVQATTLATGSLQGVTQYGVPVYDTLNSSYYLGSPDYTLMPVLTCSSPKSGVHGGQRFNASCFAQPTVGGVNQRYQFPYVHGPIFYSNDLTAGKSFATWEKQSVEFKVSAFNFLNHAVTGYLNSNGDDTLSYTAGVLNSAGMVINPTDGKSYPIGTPTTKNGVRVLELSLKYAF